MLTAVNGYIDDDRVVVDESIADWQGRRVVVIILDGLGSNVDNDTVEEKARARKAAAKELAGLWQDQNDDISVEETVRAMRRGRSFDT